MTIRVLVAEDEATVRRALSELISSEEGFELAGAAADADEAIELIVERKPDVALVDVKMPGGGGPRVAREISASCPGTRIVALSAYEDQSSVFQMLRSGAVSYLVKGAPLAEIVDTIHKASRGQAVLSTEVTSDVVHALAGRLEHDAGAEERRHAQVGRIRAVLEGEALRCVFQPIVDLADGRMLGYEALARFDALPSRTPDVWFAEAGGVGLRTELERLALHAALDALPQLPPDQFLAVNLSPECLLVPSIVAELAIDPSRIVVEITEHAQIEDYEVLNQGLLELRSAGLRVAIDDAGAGYNSFRHVIEIAPNMIKIDGSLTQRIEVDRGRRALASALISFAAEMNQLVVAEGIETRSAVDALTGLGVHCGQGHYLGRPHPLAA